MDQSYRIIRFGPARNNTARDLASLHMRLFPCSPLSALGHRFLRRHHYTLLSREGFIFGAIAYVGDRPAGFICATLDSHGFMRAAMKAHLLRWTWVAGVAALRSRRSLAAISELYRIMMSRKMSACQGEILSMGILPEYRTFRFTDDSGVHLANDLLDTVMDVFREHGVGAVRALADNNNYIAHRLQNPNAGTLESLLPQSDWRILDIEFILRPTTY